MDVEGLQLERRPLTDRLERFCQAMARGMSQTAAGVEAGWSQATAYASGSRAAKRPDVQARIAYLRESQADARLEAIRAVEMPTRELVLRELIEVLAKARAGNQLQAHLRAIELLGKELGMFIQRSAVVVESPLAGLSNEALVALSAVLEGRAEEQLELEHEAETGTLNPRTDDAVAMSDV